LEYRAEGGRGRERKRIKGGKVAKRSGQGVQKGTWGAIVIPRNKRTPHRRFHFRGESGVGKGRGGDREPIINWKQIKEGSQIMLRRVSAPSTDLLKQEEGGLIWVNVL